MRRIKSFPTNRMSFPAALSGQSMAAMTVMSPVDGILQIFNNNPYFNVLIIKIIVNLFFQ